MTNLTIKNKAQAIDAIKNLKQGEAIRVDHRHPQYEAMHTHIQCDEQGYLTAFSSWIGGSSQAAEVFTPEEIASDFLWRNRSRVFLVSM